MRSNEAIVREFIQAWSRLDVDELAAYFTEDGAYHNMPIAPVVGRIQVRAFIARFLKGWTRTEWEVLTLVAAGDIVIVERLDRTWIGERAVELPCCGVFQLAQGKIRVWRDYFDMATYLNAVSG